MCNITVFTCIMTMIFIFTIIFITSVFMFKRFCKCSRYFPFHKILTVRLLTVSFSSSQCYFLLFNALLKNHKTFWCDFAVYMKLIFYTITRPCRRHWITSGNMFTYVCCQWFFKITFRSIYCFNKRFKICMKYRWCF